MAGQSTYKNPFFFFLILGIIVILIAIVCVNMWVGRQLHNSSGSGNNIVSVEGKISPSKRVLATKQVSKEQDMSSRQWEDKDKNNPSKNQKEQKPIPIYEEPLRNAILIN